ncbi:MAG TPA: SHOCT domain-containing protein [Anaerolineae bacterium]|nr:SHOCT domain-containing protein [Anaerolineae bacterium]HOQ97892.1 SHOCT domain-containing protein [Anaerolineae bacterium]HPL26710.1 SHOCT domain-containing protein [Anaerolineae bacterium]
MQISRGLFIVPWLVLWFVSITVFWLVVVGGVLWALSLLFPKAGNGAQAPALPPIEILKRRYARGEITRAEYEEIRRELER